MSDLTGWCVVADDKVIVSGLTWESAEQITYDAADTGMYTDVYVLHSSQLGEIK